MSYISTPGGGGSTPVDPTIKTITHVSTTPYIVLAADQFISVDSSSIAITIQLPDAPKNGKCYIVKDSAGHSDIRNITITTVGGTVVIDSATSEVINSRYESISIIFNGSKYEIY